MKALNNEMFKLMMSFKFIREKNIDIFKNIQQLKKSQYYSNEQLRAIQLKKLKKIIKYSYENVPYYHQLFKNNNIHANDIKTHKDLKKIPLLTKKEIRKNLNQMIPTKIKKETLFKNFTGGSTGEPLTFYQCKNYLNWAEAGRLLAWYIIPGFDYGARTAILWGSEQDIRDSQSFFYRLGKYCNGTITMNTFMITDEKLEFFIKRLNKFKPYILRGYASSLFLLSNYIEKYQVKIPEISCVISCAEVLHEHQRKKLEEVFNCNILNSYGCREVSSIAMECSCHQGLHVLMENQIVEILDSNEDVAPNEIGDVIVTNLNNFGMPFIRYKIEDMARQSSVDKCNCNRGLSLIEKIIGRSTDKIITPFGNHILSEYFIHKLGKMSGVVEYKIVQYRKDSVVIYIVGNLEINKDKINELKNQMMNDIGEGIQIQVKYLDQIKKPRSGKHRFVISYVD